MWFGSRNCRACGEVVSWGTAWKLQLCFLGRSCGILDKLTTGKPYWHHPGAKFGLLVDDVEAKLGYGDVKWVLASYVGPIWGVKCKDRSNILGPGWG